MLIIGIDPGISGANSFFKDGRNNRCYRYAYYGIWEQK